MALASPGLFGKYRAIVVAVAFFLVFDLGVLVLNFYTSFRIAEDAVMINLSGRQRMLSQRTAKAVFQVEEAVRAEHNPEPALKELRDAVSLFDTTLAAFRTGGTVTGSDAQPVLMAGVRTPESFAVLDQAEAVWKPYLASLQPLISGTYSAEQLHTAVAQASAQNNRVLGLMNELTTQLEREATAQANWLRMVQTTGIVLALFNFVFILFKFLRQLRAADAQVERKQKENDDILRTVGEGLFLLGADWKVGSQVSQSTSRVLGHEVAPGADFAQVLRRLLPGESFGTAHDYIGLLLSGRVKEALVADINPLTAIEVQGGHGARFLSFRFNSVREAGTITHLLVTVIDVTRTVSLEQELTEARRKARDDAAILLQLFRREPEVLAGFIDRTEAAMNQANDLLRSADERSARLTVDGVFRLVHALKGEASALDLGYFEGLAERFEDQLETLRERGHQLSSDDLLALPLLVDEMFERIAVVRETLSNFSRSRGLASIEVDTPPTSLGAGIEPILAELVERIAREQGKNVGFTADLALYEDLPAATRDGVRDIAMQLVRNAVVHGIEPEAERVSRGKPARGRIHLALHPGEAGRMQLVARDDGRGIDPERIRASLVASGRFSASEAAALNEKALIAQIFEAGVSTADTVDLHAGRGVGMDIVRNQVSRLGAHLKLSSRLGEFTSFRIALPGRTA